MMTVNLNFFGQLTDITKTGTLQLDNIADTNAMQEELFERFPGLRQMKFVIAVNNTIIKENTALSNDNSIALMPPFSGG